MQLRSSFGRKRICAGIAAVFLVILLTGCSHDKKVDDTAGKKAAESTSQSIQKEAQQEKKEP